MAILDFFKKLPSALKWVLLAALCIAVAFVAGRYSAPTKTITKVETKVETKIEYKDREVVKWKEKVVEKDVWDKHKTCTEKFDKDTGKLLERVCTTDTSHSSDSSSTNSGTSDTTHEGTETHTETKTEINIVEKDKEQWRIGVTGWLAPTLSLDLKSINVIGEVDRRILGPFWLGARVMVPGPSQHLGFGFTLSFTF